MFPRQDELRQASFIQAKSPVIPQHHHGAVALVTLYHNEGSAVSWVHCMRALDLSCRSSLRPFC